MCEYRKRCRFTHRTVVSQTEGPTGETYSGRRTARSESGAYSSELLSYNGGMEGRKGYWKICITVRIYIYIYIYVYREREI